MRKKFCLLLLALTLVPPIGYAALFSFTGPVATLSVPSGLMGVRPRRENYKPYPAPRGAVPVSWYGAENKRHFEKIAKDFKETGEQYDQAIGEARTAANDFDELFIADIVRSR